MQENIEQKTHDTETPGHSENRDIDLKKQNTTHEKPDNENALIKPKAKHRRKSIDPKDGKKISEEYDTMEEEDDNNLIKSDEVEEQESTDDANNEYNAES